MIGSATHPGTTRVPTGLSLGRTRPPLNCAFTVPPSVTLQPPSVTLQPPSVTLQPPSVTVHVLENELATGRPDLVLKSKTHQMCCPAGPRPHVQTQQHPRLAWSEFRPLPKPLRAPALADSRGTRAFCP